LTVFASFNGLDGMLIDLPQGMLPILLQTGVGSSLDDLSTSEVVVRTLMFLAVLLVVGWLAKRLK
jgi:hypothetical protein